MAEEETLDFNQQIIQLVEEKGQMLDAKELPKIQEAYRLHLTCIKNLFEALENKNLITPDPYKKEKKISKIVVPDTSEYNDNERSIELGVRCSDYEIMIDFVCNYMRFSVSQLTMDKIRKLAELNATFAWNNLTENSPKANTRGLAVSIKGLRTNASPITLSLIKDTTHKSSEAITEINNGLKALADFQRENYKIEVRRNVLLNPGFNKEKASASPADMIAEIKRLYPSCMANKPFVPELVNEIVAEETAANKAELQAALIQKFKKQEDENKKKEVLIDTHELLMEAIRSLAGLSELFNTCCHKVAANHEILQSEHNSFKDKFMKFLRKLFGLADPEIEYTVVLVDKKTEAKRKETIRYNEFMENLSKRARYFSSFAVKHSPGYNRLYSMPEEKGLEFLNTQISDCNYISALLSSLDDYFKNMVNAINRTKIKGVKMELTTIKNILVKVNQHRAEYTAYKEEQDQMRKLGIIHS